MEKIKPIWSFQRAKILSLVNHTPMTIAQLIKETGLKRTAVFHHIESLQKMNLIQKTHYYNQQGKPVFITTDKSDAMSIKTIKLVEKLFGLNKKK
jgi:predicted ArsR family transcriptional regulator